MIIKDNKKIKLYYGNCRPVRVMKNNKLLGGWKKTGMNSSEAEFDSTFNDVITLHGRGANIPSESKSGEIITADNVYEVEHTLNCYLTSDTITDFSVVKVSRYGKNLFNGEFNVTRYNETKTEIIPNGIRVTKKMPSDSCFCQIELGKVEDFKDQTITVSYNKLREDKATQVLVVTPDSTASGGTKLLEINRQGNNVILTAHIDETLYSGQYVNLRVYVDSSKVGEVGDYTDFTNFQIEIGSTATNYEPYMCQTITANADGTVDGLTSLSPNMTIMTDTEGAVINAHYLKSLVSDSLPPAPDNIRPVIGAKGKITVTDREGKTNETQCPELYGVEVSQDAPYNYTEMVDGVKKYYITDTLEGKTITRRIGRLELTGAEDGWERYINGNEKTFVLPCNTSLKSSLVKCICNAFTGLTRSEIYIGGMGISCSGGFIRVSQEIDGVFLRDIEVFKAFLAEQYAKGTPVTIYYALAEPTVEVLENPIVTFPLYTAISTETDTGYLTPKMSGSVKVVDK